MKLKIVHIYDSKMNICFINTALFCRVKFEIKAHIENMKLCFFVVFFTVTAVSF